MINTHPALLPAFPGLHGPRDALAYGVKITGATVFLVDAGVDTGVILAQQAVPVRDDDTVGSCTNGSRSPNATCWWTSPISSPPGRGGSSSERWRDMTDATRRPIRRALVSVYDKTDLVELARALVDAGVEIVSTGSTARTSPTPACR